MRFTVLTIFHFYWITILAGSNDNCRYSSIRVSQFIPAMVPSEENKSGEDEPNPGK